MIIRKYNPNKDFLFILNSEKEFIITHGEDATISPKYLKKYWNHSGFHLYILEKKSIQIGYVISVYNGKDYELNTIYIRKSFRNKGYMFKLLSFLLDELSSEKKIVAEHIEGDFKSEKTLLKCGFKFIKRESCYYADKDSLVYERELYEEI